MSISGLLTRSLVRFLSIQAQDFIEDADASRAQRLRITFLSIQAQDFIEERISPLLTRGMRSFLSIQAQNFIEDPATCQAKCRTKDS